MYVLEYYNEALERWEEIRQYGERWIAIDAFVATRCELDRSYGTAEEPKVRLRRAGSTNSIANNGYAGGR